MLIQDLKCYKGGTKWNDYTDNEFDAELEKDMDAGENPTTKQWHQEILKMTAQMRKIRNT